MTKLTVLFAAAAMVLGAFSYKVTHKPSAPVKPLSLVGFVTCGKWEGGIIVMSDGTLKGSTDLTTDAAKTLAAQLPKDHSMVVTGCEKGINT